MDRINTSADFSTLVVLPTGGGKTYTAVLWLLHNAIDRSRLDVGAIAKHIWDEDLGQQKSKEYLDSLWSQEDDNLLRLFFERKSYFLHQIEYETYRCACCGMESANRAPFHVDHILPTNKGGKCVPEKLQILCHSCNGHKGGR